MEFETIVVWRLCMSDGSSIEYVRITSNEILSMNRLRESNGLSANECVFQYKKMCPSKCLSFRHSTRTPCLRPIATSISSMKPPVPRTLAMPLETLFPGEELGVLSTLINEAHIYSRWVKLVPLVDLPVQI